MKPQTKHFLARRTTTAPLDKRGFSKLNSPAYQPELEEYDASPTKGTDPEKGYLLVSKQISPSDPCRQPHPWPDWTPLSTRAFIGTEMNRMFLDLPAPPHDPIPEGWTRDWRKYSNTRTWQEYYGGMKWFFNDVLHIPGTPRLVLLSVDYGQEEDDWSTSGDTELIEIEGQFFLNRRQNFQTFPILGELTLEQVLAGLRRERELNYGEPWKRDEHASFILTAWRRRRYRAIDFIAGKNVY
ncbi:hypothetical protein FRB93_004006 [Tulasnella sp. JGI-2019a]|nr:hypothetical protein FRB93_004006 [Tulasnella sp. JGI-2019a]